MLLTHLFLSSAEKSADTGSTPFFLSLKNYKDTTSGIVDFIWKSAREFDAVISQNDIITALQEKNLVLLMDGLDEIVVELIRTKTENETLRQKLNELNKENFTLKSENSSFKSVGLGFYVKKNSDDFML